MRSIGLSVAGFYCAISSVAAGLPPAPAILTFPDLKALEAKVAAHPEDRASAALLGQNYAIAILGIAEFDKYGLPTKFVAPGEAAPYSRNQLAQTHAATILGPAGTALWNYGITLRGSTDSKDLASACVEHAIEMEPSQSDWRRQHIEMTLTREQFKAWRPISSTAALALVREDLNSLTGARRTFELDKVALLAYRTGDLAQAESLARELLTPYVGKVPLSGDAVFKGNEVLGLVALKHGDIAGAKQYLRLSGETKGSPVLGSFGPNMALAAALADAGETEAVVAFFEQCRSFWKMENGRLREWTLSVQGGVKPNYGGNLVY